MTSPIDDLGTVLDAVGDLVAAVRQDQWSAPTPCSEWTVRELVNHMVIGDRLAAGILRGEATVARGALDPKTNDALGDDPVAAHRSAAAAMLAAFRLPGVLERPFEFPVGVLPGIAAVHLRTTEALVHGWDLAQATGRQPRFPDDTVERELEFTRAQLPAATSGRTPFAPPQPSPDNAPPITRLAALLGRPEDSQTP